MNRDDEFVMLDREQAVLRDDLSACWAHSSSTVSAACYPGCFVDISRNDTPGFFAPHGVICANNPVNFVDPFGLLDVNDWSSGGGSIMPLSTTEHVGSGGYDGLPSLTESAIGAIKAAKDVNTVIQVFGIACLIPPATEVGVTILTYTSLGDIGLGVAESVATDSITPFAKSVSDAIVGYAGGKVVLEIAGLPGVVIKATRYSSGYASQTTGRYVATQVGRASRQAENVTAVIIENTIEGNPEGKPH